MSRDWHYIVTEIQARRRDRQPVLDDMQAVSQRYRGDYVIPFPGQDENNQLPPMAPALVADIIDHTAMNAASVLPMITCPAVDAGKERGLRSREFARVRTRAMTGSWSQDGMKLHLRKVIRQLVGYGTFSMLVTPDFYTGRPCVEVRDPLSAFPEPRGHSDLRPPSNIGFVVARSADWICNRFPNAKQEFGGIIPKNSGEAMWDVLEWVDEADIVFGLLGPREDHIRYASDSYTFPNMELTRFENRMGSAGAISPNRVSLDDIASQVKNIIGQVDFLNRLMALDVIASEKLIFPDRYVVGSSAMRPKINDNGEWRPGWDGKPNVILDAEQIGVLPGNIDPQSRQMVDRVERNVRTSGGALPQFGGETANALRTGRGMDSMMGAALEPRIQEIHEVMEYHLAYLNEAWMECYKGYWPDKKFSMYTGQAGDMEIVEFTPAQHFEVTYNTVNYPVPGANKSATTVELSQQLGAGAISLEDYRLRHPDIKDPQAIEQQIYLEAMETGILQLMQQGIGTGTFAIEDVIEAAKQIKGGNDIFTTFQKVQELAQERQATLAEEQAANQVAPPASQPGVNPPGTTGGEQPFEDEPIGPTEDQSGLFRLIGATQAGMQ